MIEIVTPSSRAEWLDLKKSTVGMSEAPALLGCHRWLTRYKLFMLKTGQYEEVQQETIILENSIHLPPLERGNFMEDKMFELTRMLRPDWDVISNAIPGGRMFIDRETGLSSTPDAFFLGLPDHHGRGAFQGKTVAPLEFDKNWKNESGEIQFPLYVAVQAIGDAMLSGCEWACAGAMVSGFGVDFYLIDVPLTAGLMDRIRREVSDFWRRVRENDPYPPDYRRDGDVIKGVYADDDGGEIDLSGNEDALKLVARREALKRCEAAGTDAETERKTIDNKLRFMLGNAVRGILADGRVVEAKTVRNGGSTIPPFSYRAIKIKTPKRKVV
jgi:hypothetical protein